MRKQSRRKPQSRRPVGLTALFAAVERVEPRVMMSVVPYTFSHAGQRYTATPDYEYLNAATGTDSTATPLGSSTPNGAPIVPSTLRSAYGLNNVSFTTPTGTITGNGAGQTIAIVDVGSDPDIAADLATFDSYYNLPAPPSFQQLSQTGSSTNLPAVAQGWPGEISLDVEWSHVVAPAANIILFAASDLYAADQYAATVPGVSVVSQSFTVGGTVADSTFTTPSGHAGVSFFAGNGDTGSEVPSPAQDADVVAVGGTHLNVNNNGSYNSESTWSAGGGGVSSTEAQPAYQAGIVSAYSTTQRTTPDVSLDADPGSGVAIVDSYDSPAGNTGPWELIIGGTSLATPMTAGEVAIADQGRVAAGLTSLDGGSQLLPRFYQLSESNYAANYHDVTTGNNGHPAAVGYDLGTGLGTPIANVLLPDLAGADTVSGRAYTDTNADGVYTAGTDTPLAGKTVYLDLGNTGAQVPTDPTTTTAADGTYSFPDVIGSITGTVRLVGTTGQMPEQAGTFTTAYDTNQTYDLAFTTGTATYTATTSAATTAKSVTLGVTATGTVPSGVTYTWAASTVPVAGTAVTFSANGTTSSQSPTVTFGKAGTYVLTVKVATAAGQFATASVTVVVTQVLTTIAYIQPGNLTGGQSEQLTVNGYDQFANLIGPQPGATWTVTAGGGTVTPAGVYTGPAAGTLATVKATFGNLPSVTGTVPVVALPWTSADVGTVTVPGVAYDNNGTTTLTDTSDDIWNQSDDFHFDYQTLTGDGTITAKLVSQTSASTYVKAGVMIRNSLSNDDVMAMEADPSTQPGGPLFEWRTSTTTNAAQDATSGTTVPCWVRLVRSGTTFTGYSSADGVNWKMTGTQTLTMGTTVYVGLALTSHDSNNSATAQFTNVSIVPATAQVLTTVKVLNPPVNLTAGQPQQLFAEGYDQNGLPLTTQPAFTWTLNSGGGTLTAAGLYTPPTTGTLASVTATAGSLSATATVAVVQSPWTSTDIGTVGIAGTAYDSATTTTLTNASDDIWNQSDDFHFDYQTLTGNGSITAKLVSQTSASNYIKAGLMVRNTLDPASAMAMVTDPANGAPFEWRTVAGGTANQVGTTVNHPAPYWLRLTRAGNLLTGYMSPDGVTWTAVGSTTIALNNTVYVGLALSSHNATALATAVFGNVSIVPVTTGPTVATAAAASPSPVTGTTTALSVLGASAAGESTLTYTWAATTTPSGATAPTFSANGTNAAKATTATFFAAGSYTFQVTITDAAGQTVTSTVSVVVNQTLTALAVSPSPVNLSANASQQLAVTGTDQFGNALATTPTVTWAVKSGGGTVTSAGKYTAPATGTLAVVTATVGTLTGSATIGVVGPLFTSVDIGGPAVAGLAYDSATTTTTVTGSGTDIFNAADQFHFDYETVLGTSAIAAQVTATPVVNADGTTTPYAKAGVMYRDSTAAGASFVDLVYTDSSGLQLIERNGTGTNATQVGANVSVTGPIYLELVRTGQTYAGYYSTNGTTWTPVATYADAGIGSAALVGLAVTSHSTTELATATFANVLVSQPTIATAAAAPATVTGTTAALSVLGADAPSTAGEASLTYTWVATSGPTAAVPTFSANGTNAAKNTTVTFAAVGTYTFQVTAADRLGQSVTSSVTVNVTATVTTIQVTPAAATLIAGQSTQFTAAALDQFGAAVATTPNVTWAVTSGSGTITAAGLYTAGSTPGSATVSATTAAGVVGTATVTVGSNVIVGTPGNDTIRLVRSGANLLVYVDNPTAPAYTLPYASLGSLAVDTGTGTDAVDVDFSGDGSPVPAGGLSVAGGGGAADSLVFTGTVLSDAATVTATAVTFDGGVVAYSGVAAIVDDGDGGTDTLTQAAQPGGGATLTFNATADDGPSIADALTVAGGTFAFPAPAAGSGVADLLLGSLSVRNGATVAVGTAAAQADRYILTVNALSLAGAGSTLDLGGNDLHLATGTATAADRALAAVAAEVAAGSPFAGAVTGPRITSSAVAANPTQLALGYAVAGPTITSLDGDAVNPTDVLVRPTIFGDANLDGVVDGQDYAAIDAGFLSQGTATPLTGWENGDFNGDGVVDGSDYTLIDNAFNTQPMVAASTAEVAPARPQVKKTLSAAVPYTAAMPTAAATDENSDKGSAPSKDVLDRLNER